MAIITKDMTATINGSGYNQFGKEVLITQMSFSLLEAIFEVDPEVQRKLDPQRRSEIRDFILQSVENEDFCFSPFVFSPRGAITKTDNGWVLTPRSKRDVYTKLLRNFPQTLSSKYEIEQKLSRISKQSSAPTSLSIMRKCLLAMFDGALSAKWDEPSYRYIHSNDIE